MTTKWSPAPDFQPGYPSKGEIIGPLWQGVWTLLGELEGWSRPKRIVSRLPKGVNPKTVSNLLHAAAKLGLIDKRARPHARGGVRSSFRRFDGPLTTPEKQAILLAERKLLTTY